MLAVRQDGGVRARACTCVQLYSAHLYSGQRPPVSQRAQVGSQPLQRRLLRHLIKQRPAVLLVAA